MARKRRRSSLVAGELNLTAMIDVAFQLLSFFIMTSRPMDVMTNLDVSRPAADSRAVQTDVVEMVQIAVFRDGYQINDKIVTLNTLEGLMIRLAGMSKTQTILIKSAPDATHEDLVKVLDLCAKVGLENISIMSL